MGRPRPGIALPLAYHVPRSWAVVLPAGSKGVLPVLHGVEGELRNLAVINAFFVGLEEPFDG